MPSCHTPSREQGEVYKIAREEEQPLTVYIKRRTSEEHSWYRIQSWPVVFLGFEEFDLRVHRVIDWNEGWAVSEATTGMAIVKCDDPVASPSFACDQVAWHIVRKNITPEKLREKIAGGKERLKALGLVVPSEKARSVPVLNDEQLCEIYNRGSGKHLNGTERGQFGGAHIAGLRAVLEEGWPK